MKKYLALILGVLFVLSFAASAFAIHSEIPSDTQAAVAKGSTQITLGGELRTRGWYRDNITDVLIIQPGDDLLLKNMPVKSDSQAYYDQRVRLSLDAAVSPNIKGYVMLETGSGTSDVYTWGNFNTKPSSLLVNEAWILYTGSGLLGFNSGLKIGHMPLTLGQKEFFDHTKFGDDAIVFFMDPIKQLHIGLLTIKLAGDGNPSTIAAFNNLNAAGSKFEDTDDLDGYVALMTFKINDSNKVGVNYTYLNQSALRLSHQNLGVHADGKIAGVVGYTAAADMQFGKLDRQKFRGYAAMLGASFNVNPVNIRANVAIGSGDDDNDNKIEKFITYLGADQHYTLVYDYQVIPAGGYVNAGLTNTTYANLGVDFNASKDLALSLDGYLLRATKTGHGISKSAGWEVDAKVKYALAKNLTYQVDAGYFKAGDMYEDMMFGLLDAKGVTVLRHMLTLSF